MTIYNLHYIGQGLYNVGQFEAEAKKHGVARALPARVIRTLKWGDLIMLGQWVPDYEKQKRFKQMTVEESGEPAYVTFKRYGSARVFGFFNVTGLNMSTPQHTELEAVAKAKLADMLDVERIETHKGGGMSVTRRCGSYTVMATYFVRDSIESIMDKAAEVEKSMGIKFKWFVTGHFTSIEETILDPARFSRGIVKIDVSGDPLPIAEKFKPGVSFIYDYQRKTYQPKEVVHEN